RIDFLTNPPVTGGLYARGSSTGNRTKRPGKAPEFKFKLKVRLRPGKASPRGIRQMSRSGRLERDARFAQRALVGIPRHRIHAQYGAQREPDRAGRAIDEGGNAQPVPSGFTNQVEDFAGRLSGGHHVFNNQRALAGGEFEPPPEPHPALLSFGEQAASPR